jgi:hypothetical protein
MPEESTRTQQDKQRQASQQGGQGGSQDGKASQQGGQGTNDRKSGQSAKPKTGQQGGPGPHGSSDPETAERNKNKPLMDDWGKGDKR